MTNSINAPKLNNGQYSVLKSEMKTGHVLQVNGELYIGQGEVFKIVESFEKAIEYMDNELKENNSLEFILFDWHGKKKLYRTIDKNEKLES